MGILHNRNRDCAVLGEYEKFMERNLNNIRKKVDDCISDLIIAMLSDRSDHKENDLVEKVVSALQNLFPPLNVAINSDRSGDEDFFEIDAEVLIGDFPFIIIEVKSEAYSIHTVLQGLQYYGLLEAEFIDNDPCFLITLDRGIFYLYGVAKVNRRVVCTCLLTLEFTNYHFNIEGFSDTLYRCISGLYFFYERFSARIPGKYSDPQHEKYSEIKSAASPNDQPFPAIFSVQLENDPNERIEITFQKLLQTLSDGGGNVYQAFFKSGVYFVKTQDGRDAVLKISNKYNIEVHRKLSEEQLAPRIFGYEKLWNQFHVILMEYFDDSSYKLLFHFLQNSKKIVNCENLFGSLKSILEKLENFGLVHGDFRSSNIFAKESENDPSILKDFKLIDFELSGRVGEPYPFMALKNCEITWPEGFNSYMPRKFDHDTFMLRKMKENEF